LPNPPGRSRLPTQQFFGSPVRGLVGVAGGTWIRHLVLVSHRGSNELKSVRADKRARHALGLDLGHVAGYTLAAGATVVVVGVFL